MAYITPEIEDSLEISDTGPVSEKDQIVNTKGASLNYTLWSVQAEGPFCADKSSLKGDD